MTIEEAGDEDVVIDKVQSSKGLALSCFRDPVFIQTKPMSIPIAVIQLPDDENSAPSRAKVCAFHLLLAFKQSDFRLRRFLRLRNVTRMMFSLQR